MKKKKIMAVLVSTMIAASSLCGCGNSGSGSYDMNNAVTSDGVSGAVAESWDYYDEEMGMLQEPYMENGNTEEYSSIHENGYQSVANAPLSTFSADVDTASYSNLRRMIENGCSIEDIPGGAIRIEEMLNYFSYDYNLPDGDEPFGVTTVMGDCPWNKDALLLQIGLKTEEIDFSEAPDSNLVFLLDVSGSMYSDDKLPLLQKSFAMLAEELTEKDRVSIVTYAGSDEVVLEGARGDDKSTIINALESLEAGGSTNGADGIITAYRIAEHRQKYA